MKLSIGQIQKEYDTWTAEQIWQEIETELEKQGLLLNYMTLDGEEVWEDFFERISEGQGKLQTIEVVALTLEEYTAFVAEELGKEAEEEAEQALRLSDSFYAEREKGEDWQGLSAAIARASESLPTIELLHALIQAQPEQAKQAAVAEKLYGKLQADLRQFQKPLAEEDVILIADLLHFELEHDLRELARCCKAVRAVD